MTGVDIARTYRLPRPDGTLKISAPHPGMRRTRRLAAAAQATENSPTVRADEQSAAARVDAPKPTNVVVEWLGPE